MPDYLAPGIYAEEIHSGARPIFPASTSTTAFFGVAPDPEAHLREPILVTSMAQFTRDFAEGVDVSTHLSLAVNGFFENGGSKLYIINLGAKADTVTAEDTALLDIIATLDHGDDRVKHADPSLIAAPGYTDQGSVEALLRHCEAVPYRFAVLDMADGCTLSDMQIPQAEGGARPRYTSGGVAAVYTPWLLTTDPVCGAVVPCPPSGHVCGIYARNDSSRGVHKAPANEVPRGILGLTREITNGQHDVLNARRVNCIRTLEGRGTRVWGARTLIESESGLKYVNIRRLLSMIERSIDIGTRWAVFERNGEALWTMLRHTVEAFLHRIWVGGMLLGTTANEAFFVRCDRTTMTQTDIDAGRVILQIGVALTRPAEFTVVRIGQPTMDAI